MLIEPENGAALLITKYPFTGAATSGVKPTVAELLVTLLIASAVGGLGTVQLVVTEAVVVAAAEHEALLATIL